MPVISNTETKMLLILNRIELREVTESNLYADVIQFKANNMCGSL